MYHQILIDLNPDLFAFWVVAGMAGTGLLLGLAMERVLARFISGSSKKGTVR